MRSPTGSDPNWGLLKTEEKEKEMEKGAEEGRRDLIELKEWNGMEKTIKKENGRRICSEILQVRFSTSSSSRAAEPQKPSF